MGWQCAVQMLGLVRGDGMRRDGKGKTKHRANAAAIVNEAFLIADPEDGHPIPYRKSASETYDRTRTTLNKYGDIKTADRVMQALEDEADKQKIEVQTVDKTTGQPVTRYRGLQSNTPIGIAVIFNPPGEITRDWSQEKCAKFIADCEDCLVQIPCMKIDKKGQIKRDKNGDPVEEPRYLFRKENLIAHAEHWDEGEPGDPPVYSPNWHNIYLPKDQYGKYNGSMVDTMFFSVVLNRMFPQLMRERGWDIDETRHTDWEQFAEDKEYRTEAKARIKKGGRSVNRYRADKKLEEAEAHLEEAASMVEQAAAIMEDVGRREQEADEKVRMAEADRDKVLAERDEAVSQKDQALKDKEQAEADADDAFMERQRLDLQNRLLDDMQASSQEHINALAEERDTASAEVQKLRTEITASRKERDALLSEVADAESELDNAKAEAKRTKAEVEAAKADRDAARKEADDLRRDAVAKAELAGREAAKAVQAKIEADAREAWKDWLDSKKRQAEAAAAKIIEDAKARAAEMIAAAAEAAQGEYAFLLEWLADPHQRYKTGESFLDVARAAHMREIRKRRMSAIPPEVRGAERGRQTGTGRTGPEG